MVVTDLPASEATGVTQDRTGCPLTWTVQAPHRDMPQPNLVPVIWRWSRRTQSRGMAAGRSTVCGVPLSVKRVAGIFWKYLRIMLARLFVERRPPGSELFEQGGGGVCL